MDKSNGYEVVAGEFLALRSRSVGAAAVRAWARTLPRGAAAIDLGCGAGVPITQVLVTEGLKVFGVDAAPSLVREFRRNVPNATVTCEAVQDSKFFNRSFDAVLAWGLMFLLCSEDQRRLIQRIASILVPGGCLLFTSPGDVMVWDDSLTGRESRSLGSKTYRKELGAVGLDLSREFEDEGQNHYFELFRKK